MNKVNENLTFVGILLSGEICAQKEKLEGKKGQHTKDFFQAVFRVQGFNIETMRSH